MTPAWGSALTALAPLALVVAASPITVIPAVLVLHTPTPRASGLGFAAGWLLGVGGLTAVFVAVSGLLGGLGRTPPGWASWLRIVVGAALIGVGVYRWLTRERHTAMPRWMRSLTTLRPSRAAGVAVALAVARPEVLGMCAAAGLAVGSAGLTRPESWLAAAIFVAVATSSVLVPIGGFVAAGPRLEEPLTRLKTWMEAQHAVMLAVVLVLIGAMVLYNGVHAL
ncbi:GAP family protein [Mycolicibacillus parakoreensis]|uniref:GAP family protein n=1 Tax=Mycolicibacillus parakoreensis TaxID=1069221 RepID=A0ABY3TXS2_9MYCO|nr:GAP family protein [Mycolicibacillus parakoreensis]MCV7316269.1 GAP family protein [Mycolicibacillus parakoreensis]ULN52518.1 GAP family protein [Mycolicibacillus parakoreensis]HLS00093.1 GAP family protein [Mycolicibacillus parakoreensis]